MWEFLKEFFSRWPVVYSFFLTLAVLVSIVIIVLRGKITAKLGKNIIGVGVDEEAKIDKKPINDSSPDTTSLPKRRCGDCVLIMMGEREKYEIKMRRTYDNVLKKQMVFAEQKLIEIQSILIDIYTELYSNKKNKEEYSDNDIESIQNRLFYGLIRDALINIKDEFRRSFKENGFFEYNGVEFSNYVKDRVKIVINKITQHIRNLYPNNKMTITINEIIENIEKVTHQIEDIMFEVYTQAKEVKNDAEKLEKQLRTEFSQWIDSFIG